MIRVFVVFRIFGVFIEYFIFSDNEEIIEFVIDKDIGIVKLWYVIVYWIEKNKKFMMYVIFVNYIKFFVVLFLF